MTLRSIPATAVKTDRVKVKAGWRWAGLLIAAAAMQAHAAKVVEGDDRVVASRGGVSLTLAEIDARVMELPPKLRSEYLNDPVRIEETIGSMLMEKQLAKKAYELGADKDPYLELQMEQARTRFLASRARTLNEQQLQMPDFTELAEEAYLANPEKYTSPETLDLTHILVSESGRTAEDAKARAEEARRLATAGGRDFASLVADYSDETRGGVKTDGKLPGVTRNMMVPEFDKVAFELKNPGDVSDVVKTRFGYHVIRLESRKPAVKAPFESVQGKIVAELESKFAAANKSHLTDEFRGMKIDADPDAVASLRERYGPDGPKGKRVTGHVASTSQAPSP